MRVPLALIGATAAAAAGLGWLYLLRKTGLLALGPSLHGALPLQQLAGNDAQPLLRLAVAWLPAGAAAWLAAARIGRLRHPVALAGTVAGVVVIVTASASDAIANGGLPFIAQLPHQAGRPALWAAVLLVLAGAGLARWAARVLPTAARRIPAPRLRPGAVGSR